LVRLENMHQHDTRRRAELWRGRLARIWGQAPSRRTKLGVDLGTHVFSWLFIRAIPRRASATRNLFFGAFLRGLLEFPARRCEHKSFRVLAFATSFYLDPA
jgi:hypothetical protein